MATSAFKSTTKRTSIGATAAGTSNSSTRNNTSAHRRSRSLSRFSHRLPTQASCEDFDDAPVPSGRFVNTIRGSGFPEITLDDLAIEFFDSGDRGRSASRYSTQSSTANGNSNGAIQRRGRSVSRQGSKVGGDVRGSGTSASGGGRPGAGSSSRRRRSVSAVRYQISDSESDASIKGVAHGHVERQSSLLPKPIATDHRPTLRRALSQKDLKSYDGESSHSSVITDDEVRDVCPGKNGFERRIRAAHIQKKGEHHLGHSGDTGLYEEFSKELRRAISDSMEIERGVVKIKGSPSRSDDCLLSSNSDGIQSVSSLRKNCATKLEQSEKRKQDLLAEIILEEQRGKELSQFMKDFLSDTKKNVIEKPLRARKRSNDRSRMSKCLTEEAEKYIEDFISNVEDTDMSSLDGERSDTSSSFGGITKSEMFHSPAMCRPFPVAMDGVVLPWLQWETSNDASSAVFSNKGIHVTPASQEKAKTHDQSNTVSSHGSWSPGMIDSLPLNIGKNLSSKFGEYCSYRPRTISGEESDKGLRFDIEDYIELPNKEDFLTERWKQQYRIASGGLLLCNQTLF